MAQYRGSPLPGVGATNPSQTKSKSNEDNWTKRPPYSICSPEEVGPVKWRGTCQCGQVTYQLSRDRPLKAKFCHCRGCQVMHGAPFQWAAIFHKSDLAFTRGAEGLSFYSSSQATRKYTLPTKVYCSFCRTPIMDEGRNVCLLFPQALESADDDENRTHWREAFEIDCHIFYGQRVLEIPDGKPKWSGLDGQSDLLDDDGQKK
ncbi:hypothetical protein BO78DRAFT_401536 [Aspergillus sclerotiicarbonarius CBS 121057]|uniref:CENP-V/GFA domain-containing protein n=1 Tax=Aspergillus sclerotiicarbonarius (strain CBS 121057 / IBT 28362) TaxID=1448318 RepID=A0A319DTR3_ASPSB|nr:hypothetical protein BO78DRAFT_401536 [Aspergillus sclerotiicarbonarius CBS 121057]